jgi:hypothetical protein
MSPIQPTQPPAVLIAIDIAKLRHDVLIEAPGWKSRKSLSLPNIAAEFLLFSPISSMASSLRSASHSRLRATTVVHWRTFFKRRVSIWS